MDEPAHWLLTKPERDNPQTVLDDQHPGDQAWSTGNAVTPLIHGAAYFPVLCEAVRAAKPGDLVLFTDWQGDADEQLTGEPGSEVLEVFGQADERGVDVRGLVWRSHTDLTGFFATENRHFGEQLQKRGAEVLLDMRVRTGGSHHQKFVVIRYLDHPERDIAFVGGIDLAHNRRDDAEHLGDPQSAPIAEEYGEHPPWHDVQLQIQGPAVHDLETVFRERWEDPTPLSRHPVRRGVDLLRRHDTTPDPLPEQTPPPPEAGSLTVQILRTYPDLRIGLDYPFANGGERSVAMGYSKAIANARDLIYVEDQYFWGYGVAEPCESALRENPDLRLMVVIPMFPDVTGANRTAQILGRMRALRRLQQVAPGRVAAYGIENHEGTPVYVHAKVCVIDDTWASTGSDNFNRRSWTHDSELTAVVLDRDYARDLRTTLAAEHLDLEPAEVTDLDVFDAYARSADALDAWHDGGRVGERPPGRLRHLPMPELSALTSAWARVPLALLHDPDGRPWRHRLRRDY